MKSPFTGGAVRLEREPRVLKFRKEDFPYVAHYYVCVDTGEQFTTTEIDNLNINQVYNQYRVKYGIPFPDEIKKIREIYEIPSSKMSEILGLGTNQYRLYENGEMPSEAIGKLLKSVMNPVTFLGFVKNAEHQFSQTDYEKILEKTQHAVKRIDEIHSKDSIFGDGVRSLTNGYAPQSYSRVKNMVLFFINKCSGVFNTKMNKLLFYTDFLNYKMYGMGISGLTYRAIQYGPVPLNWANLYGSLDDVCSDIVAFPEGYSGVKLCSDLEPDMSVFSQEEIKVMEKVCNQFKNITSNDISKLSHNEDAWIKYIGKSLAIDYTEAFSLKAL